MRDRAFKVRPSAQSKPAKADPTEDAERVRSAFQQRADEEADRFTAATDSEFWVALCFQTRAQKDEFLEKLGVAALGDKYLDGRAVAAAMGIKLESPDVQRRNVRLNKRLLKLTDG
jgi:hypothetical protein